MRVKRTLTLITLLSIHFLFTSTLTAKELPMFQGKKVVGVKLWRGGDYRLRASLVFLKNGRRCLSGFSIWPAHDMYYSQTGYEYYVSNMSDLPIEGNKKDQAVAKAMQEWVARKNNAATSRLVADTHKYKSMAYPENAKMRPFGIYGLSFGVEVDHSKLTHIGGDEYSFTPKSEIRGFDKYICALTPKSSVPYIVYGAQSSGGRSDRVYEIKNALEKSYKCYMIQGKPRVGESMVFLATVDKSEPNDRQIGLRVSLSAEGMIKVSATDLSSQITQELDEDSKKLSKLKSIVKKGSASLDSWLGIPFGKELSMDQLTPSTTRDCAGMHYSFRPKNQFRDFEEYSVSITPISKITWNISCSKTFSSDKAALEEYNEVVDIISQKFSHVPGTDNKSYGGKNAAWRFEKKNHGYERSVSVSYFPSAPHRESASIIISATDDDARNLIDKERSKKHYKDADVL